MTIAPIQVADSQATLKAPFRAALPAGRLAASDLPDCKQPPPPVVSLATTSRYRQDDPSRSTVDQKASDAYEAAVKPLRAFQSEVVGWANDAVRRPAQIEKAGCALIWLSAWAGAGALSQLSTRQSEFNRDQALSALALAYLQVAAVAVDGVVPSQATVDWFRRLAHDVIHHYENEAGEMSRDNNHRYFAALAVGATAIAAQDRALFAWAMRSLEAGLCSAERSGALPMEMRRGSRARDYQLFAAGPLVVLAEMAVVNGIDAYALCDGALHRIIDFGMTSIDDPYRVEKLSGTRQVAMPPVEKRGSRLAWLAPYTARFPASPWIAAARETPRLSSTALGGNQSTLYATDAHVMR